MKHLLSLILVVLIVLPASLIYAQETRPVELPNGTVIDLPADWEFEDQEGTYLFTSGDAAYLLVMLPEVTATYYADRDVMPTPAELLVLLSANEVIDHAISEEDVEVFEGGARYIFSDADGHGSASVVASGDGLLYTEYYALNADFETVETQALNLLAQLAPVQVECYVSTDNASGAPMRLGPGVNRGEYTSLLPDDGELLVIGKANADDGSLWWRVEEDYDAVNELWVADSKVTTSGDCALVGEVTAQPPIPPAGPIVSQPPASSQDTGSDDTGGETGGDTGGEAGSDEGGETGGNPSLIPANGSWAMSASGTMMMSCTGGDTVRVGIGGFNGVAQISGATATSLTLNDGGDIYYFTGVNGYYTSEKTTGDRYSVIRLRVSSPTQMSGELAISFIGVPCSGTAPISFSYLG